MKNKFADEIALGMLKELQPKMIKSASADLVKAVDYLNTAFDILDDAGFKVQADKILEILCKIGSDEFNRVVHKQSPFKLLLDLGLQHQDILDFSKGNRLAAAKISNKLREAKYPEKNIKEILGRHYVSHKEANDLLNPQRSFTKIDDFLKDPISVSPSKKELIPGDEFSFSSLADDPHTKGLTSKKMIENLLHHGTEFNMSDDGIDLLNLEINDDEVLDEKKYSDMDFEDEIN